MSSGSEGRPKARGFSFARIPGAHFAARVTLRKLLFLGLLSASTLRVAAAASLPVLSADRQDFDLKTDESLLQGQACIVLDDQVLRADQIRFSHKTGIGIATGHVVLTKGSRRVLAEKVEYHFKDGSYTLDKPRVGEFPVYLSGASAEGNAQQLILHKAVASFLEPGPFTPTLAADTLTYTFANGSIQAQFPRLGVGTVHPLALPKFDQKMGFQLRSMLSLSGGFRSNLGAFIEPGIRLPVSENLRLGADLGIYTRRGLMFGPGGNYDLTLAPDSSLKGRFRSGYINDHGDRYVDVLGRKVASDRSYLSWEHQQKLSSSLTLEGRLGYWSDSEVVRDFRPSDFFNTQVPDTYLEALQTGENYHVSVFGRFQPNRYHEVQERLPELRYDLLPSPLVLGLYQRMQASLVSLSESSPTAAFAKRESLRADAYYGLTRNFSPREWLQLNAVAGTRVTDYSQTRGAAMAGGYTRGLAELGFDASLQSSGTWDYKNEQWKIDGLRHLFTPRISYRYIPEAERGQRYIPSIDRENFSTYLQPLGLGERRSIDDLHATNTLRLAFENTLQTRDSQYGSRDLASLTLANDFLFERQVGQRKVSETHLDLALMPTRWLRFEVYQSAAPQDLRTHEFNTGLTLHDGDVWALRLATHYLSGDISEYVLDYRHRLNEEFSIITRLHYDYRHSRFAEQSYGLRQVLDRTWAIYYNVTKYSGPRREGDFSLGFQIEAIGF
jgi:LPS-assembly protein